MDKLSERRQQAKNIAADPDNYKICFGCDSIVEFEVDICPNCHAYNFETRNEKVIEQAKKLGRRKRHQSVLQSDFE